MSIKYSATLRSPFSVPVFVFPFEKKAAEFIKTLLINEIAQFCHLNCQKQSMFPSSCCPEQRQHFIIFLLANIFFGTTLWILYVMQALRWLLCLVCNPPLVSGPIESVSCTVLNTWRQKNYNSTSPLYTSQEMISERPNRKEQDRRRYKTPSSFLKNYKKSRFQALLPVPILQSHAAGIFYNWKLLFYNS